MARWSAVLVILLGLWIVLIPWVGPLIGLNMGAMSSAPAAGTMPGMGQAAAPVAVAVILTASTLWYHLLPGVLTVLVGSYQLVAALRTATRTVSVAHRQLAETSR